MGEAPPSGRRQVALPCRRRLLPGAAAAGVVLLWLCLTGGGAAWAHPGSLDEHGGHFDDKTLLYHYHRPRPEMAVRKKKFLNWVEHGRAGELRGQVTGIDRPDAIWVRIPYRPAYQEFAALLPPGDRDDQKQTLRLWFLHVSPEASVGRGREYNQWFKKKVVFELERKLKGKDVTVQFKITKGAKRMYGMVFMGKESVNLWMVLNGWSYFLLPADKEIPYMKKFIEAEDMAKKRKSGLWKKGQ